MSVTVLVILFVVFCAILVLSGWFAREIKSTVSRYGLLVLVLLFGLLMLGGGLLVGTFSAKFQEPKQSGNVSEAESPSAKASTEVQSKSSNRSSRVKSSKNSAQSKKSKTEDSGEDKTNLKKPASKPSKEQTSPDKN